MKTNTSNDLSEINASLQSKKERLITLSTDNRVDVTESLVEISISLLSKPTFNQRQIISNRYAALELSLAEHGFVGGIFVSQSSNAVIDGWQRVECWQKLNNRTIPCFLVKCTDQQERELHLRLNTQAAQFDLTEVGLTFSGLNLTKDFGFAETDLTLREKNNTLASLEAIDKKTAETKKFTATLPKGCYTKLLEIKEENRFEDWSDVIDLLIENYNATN